MVDLEVEISTIFDPLANSKDTGATLVQDYVHIHLHQRDKKKVLTTVQGFCLKNSATREVSGIARRSSVVMGQDKELGKVMQLQADDRRNIFNFLVNADIVSLKRLGYLQPQLPQVLASMSAPRSSNSSITSM